MSTFMGVGNGSSTEFRVHRVTCKIRAAVNVITVGTLRYRGKSKKKLKCIIRDSFVNMHGY
jgi:hypothetical protein